MHRKFGVGVLIVCFGFSTVNIGWAAQMVGVAPAVAQPEMEIQELNQAMLDRDRKNRDEEIAIKNLIEENNKLTVNTLSTQQDDNLAKINQLMLRYRDALLSRDQARIVANSQTKSPWSSRYGDLVGLTEDADTMTIHRDLVAKSDAIEEKYKLLADLKDEMMAVNDKLKGEGAQKKDTLNQKDTIIAGFKNIAQQQEDKIQTLIQRLAEMDKKISHFDEILAEKDQQIAQLKENMARAQSEASVKDDTIKQQETQIEILQEEAKVLSFKNKQLQSQADQVENLSQQAQSQKATFDNTQAQLGSLKNQIQQQGLDLNEKDKLIKAQSNQLENLLQEDRNQNPASTDNTQTGINLLKSQIQQQDLDLKAKDETIGLLSKIVAQARNKEENNKSLSQGNTLSMQQVKDEVQKIKDDFAQRFKNYDEYESAIGALKNQVSQLGQQLSQKQEQVDLLKEELENKITELKAKGGNPAALGLMNHLEQTEEKLREKIATLQTALARKHEQNVKAKAAEIVNIPSIIVQSKEVQQEKELQSQVQWLNQVLAATKNKAEYYKITAQEILIKMQHVQAEMQMEKNAPKAAQVVELPPVFVEKSPQVVELPAINVQVEQKEEALKAQLSDLQAQKEELKKELELARQQAQMANNKAVAAMEAYNRREEKSPQVVELPAINVQVQEQEAALEAQMSDLQDQKEELKKELELARQHEQAAGSNALPATEEDNRQELSEQLTQLQQRQTALQDEVADLQGQREELKKELAIQQGQNVQGKAPVLKFDDRLQLATHLIQLQRQEASLLQEKYRLALQLGTLLDQHVAAFENRIETFLAHHSLQNIGLRDRIEELNNDLAQEQHQIEWLKTKLENKIAEGKNQTVLVNQIQDLKGQLQLKENQIITLKSEIQSGQGTQVQVDTLKQQLVDQQNKADLLKQELDSKNADSDKMIADYQKKLESKDNAYNEQLKQLLASRNAQAQMVKQRAYLSTQLQDSELSSSIVQQKMATARVKEYQDKINVLQATSDKEAEEVKSLRAELALARQQLQGMPSSDELEFLRTGLQQATLQLKKKDEMLAQAQANAAEYEKEFKEQSQGFQSLKQQLQDAYDDLHRKSEDLKYKSLEVIRLKERAVISNGDLQDQVKALTQKLNAIQKGVYKVPHGAKVEVLQDQLMNANSRVKELQGQLNQYILQSGSDAYGKKLRQALNKIDEQGRLLNVLMQKLHNAGQDVNSAQDTDKP